MKGRGLDRRAFLSAMGMGAAGMVASRLARAADGDDLPNIVIIFTDDQGYGDVCVQGAKGFETPNIDQMASEGVRFTDAYVAQAVCGASRAALLTGCYPNRIGMLGAPSHKATHGINPREMLLSEVCKQRGYATAMFGKWHLGHRPASLPTHHGFDEYLGLPYSNDMWPHHPTNPGGYPPLPLIEGDKVVKTLDDQSQLTTWYTERAVQFIDKNKDKPFFLYVAHNMPHVPLFVSDKYKGKSEQGMYGDVIMEIDWSVGQILGALKKNGIDKNTLVLFTCDNGPWLSYGDHAGSAGPLREGKGTAWDGGQREPWIMRWPAKIPAGTVCREPVMTIDIVPTVAKLIGAKLPDHPIDGLDILPLMTNPRKAKSPHDELYFYWGNSLNAVRSGKWKLHFPHAYRTLAGRPGGTGGTPVPYSQGRTSWALFDLQDDIGELRNVADLHPDIVERLKKTALAFDADLQANRREPQRFKQDSK